MTEEQLAFLEVVNQLTPEQRRILREVAEALMAKNAVDRLWFGADGDPDERSAAHLAGD